MTRFNFGVAILKSFLRTARTEFVVVKWKVIKQRQPSAAQTRFISEPSPSWFL